MASREAILDFLFSALRKRCLLSVTLNGGTTLLSGVYCIAVSEPDGRVVFGNAKGMTASSTTVTTNVTQISDAWECDGGVPMNDVDRNPRVEWRGY